MKTRENALKAIKEAEVKIAEAKAILKQEEEIKLEYGEYNISHIGETHITKEGYTCKIIGGGKNKSYNTIQINEWITEKPYQHIKEGRVKYPYYKSVYGKGYIGEGGYKAKVNGKTTKCYKLWNSMIQRIHDKKALLKRPTYRDVAICEEWYSFNNFAKWFYEESNYKKGWQIDKDLLSNGNKVYSPSTCVFLPQKLNIFLSTNRANNTLGLTGVSWNESSKKWAAQITIEQKTVFLGYFNTKEEASEEYIKAKNKRATELVDEYNGEIPYQILALISKSEQALQREKEVNRLEARALKIDPSWKANWEDKRQRKWYIFYDYTEKEYYKIH